MQRLRGLAAGVAAGTIASAAAYAALTAILWGLLGARQILDVALLYLLLTLVVSAIWGYRVGLTAAVAADLLVNFFFVPPLYTLTVQQSENVVALCIFLAVAAVGASMLALLRRQVRLADAGRAEASVLLDLSQGIARSMSPRDALQRLCSAITRAVGARGCAILQFVDGWEVVATTGELRLNRDDEAMAHECAHTGQVVRFGGSAQRKARVWNTPRRDDVLTFIPFRMGGEKPGVLRIAGAVRRPVAAVPSRLLAAFADEASVALDRVRLADEARKAEALRRADEFKLVILSSVSHDLRSPLTAIKASVGSLRDESIAWTLEDTRSFLETIESQTDRLTNTVAGLLQMSRLEGGAIEPSLESVAARSLLDAAVAAASTTSGGRIVDVDANDGLWLRTDYSLTLQSLVNLLENAYRYSTPGTSITLSATAVAGSHGRSVQISVADKGPGIPPGDLPHIFEKFYRGAETAGKGIGGSGLGLAIVQGMMQQSGGTVMVRSSANGTVFSIVLPATIPP